MSGEILAWIIAVTEAVAGAILVFYFKRAQQRRDKIDEEHAKARRNEMLLSMEMQMASAKLSFAVAMAIKRGSPNGEVEEGIKAYEKASEKYSKFLKEQAMEHIID